MNGLEIKEYVGDAGTMEKQNEIWNQWKSSHGKELIEEYASVRKESIQRFSSTPCEFNYDHMLCSHGVITIHEFIDKYKKVVSSSNENSPVSEIKQKIEETDNIDKKDNMLNETQKTLEEDQLQDVDDLFFADMAMDGEINKVEQIRKRLSEIDEEDE